MGDSRPYPHFPGTRGITPWLAFCVQDIFGNHEVSLTQNLKGFVLRLALRNIICPGNSFEQVFAKG